MMEETFKEEQGTIGHYVWGFVVSVILTLVAYFLTVCHMMPAGGLFYLLIALGAVQVIVQFVLFLHVGKEHSTKNRLFYLIYMLVVGAIIIAGTLWIMQSLYKRMEIKVDANQHIVR